MDRLFPAGSIDGNIVLSKMATFVLTPSSLSRLNSPAIPTVPHDFAMVCAVYLEPSGGENHSKQQ